MGNCMWTGFGSEEEGMLKLNVLTHGGNIYQHYAKKEKELRAQRGHSREYGRVGSLKKVDVTHGLDLQLENVAAPCRLSSGTAADLLSRIDTSGESRRPSLEVLPSQQKGVWKVKLVITVEQLHEILSHQSNTEALIERMSLHASASASSSSRCTAHKLDVTSPRQGEGQHQIGCFSRASTYYYCSWKPSLESISENIPLHINTGTMAENLRNASACTPNKFSTSLTA